jgi:hypothetical protein
MTLICNLNVVHQFSVRLIVKRVSEDPQQWEWSDTDLLTGAEIASGSAPSEIAAQVAAQESHERWLNSNRSRFGHVMSGIYQWAQSD